MACIQAFIHQFNDKNAVYDLMNYHPSSFPQQLGLRSLPARLYEMKLSGLPEPFYLSDPKQRTGTNINKNASVQIQVQ